MSDQKRRSVAQPRPSKHVEILGDIGVYAFGSQLTQLITLVASILTRNFLGPLQMGIWATLQIVLDYSKYTTLGSTEAVPREIPYFLGKGNHHAADEVKNVATSFSVVAAVLTATGIAGFAFLYRNRLPEQFFWGLIFVSVLAILQRLNNLMISLLRAYKQFSLASRQMVLSAIVNAALVAFFAYRYKIYGFMWAMVFSFLFNILYIIYHYDFHFKFAINRALKGLIVFGMPLLLLQLVNVLLRSVDKILIAKMLGFEAMGFYSIALLGASYLGQIPNSIGIVMIPHFHEKFGTRDRISDVKNYVNKAVNAFCSFMPLFIGLAWIVIPLFISVVMPKYKPGIAAAQYLMPGLFFVGFSQVYGNFIVVIKKHLLIFPVTGITVLIAVVIDYLMIKWGMGIAGVAAATSLVLFLNCFFLFFLAGKWLYIASESRMILGKILACFFYLIGSLLVLNGFMTDRNLWLATSFRAVLFAVLNIPHMIHLEKEFKVFKLLRMKLVSFFSKSDDSTTTEV